MAKSILVIEDEKLITKSLKKLLEGRGYGVTITNSGKEALEKVKNQEFNLIVCDVRMPHMDGIETIKEIRASLKAQGKPLVPEIFITGYADEEKYKAAVDLKVADYIYKPFDINDFLGAVERNLGG